MDFERLEPPKQSSRVGAVRILPKRPVHEKVAKNYLNESRKCLPNGATGPPWALLGPTCEILKDLGGGCFLLIFGSAENCKEIESITDLWTPRDPKHSHNRQPGRPPNSLRSQHSRQSGKVLDACGFQRLYAGYKVSLLQNHLREINLFQFRPVLEREHAATLARALLAKGPKVGCSPSASAPLAMGGRC